MYFDCVIKLGYYVLIIITFIVNIAFISTNIIILIFIVFISANFIENKR